MKRDPAALAATRWDALVVGGGIYGAMTAWDAAQRGLRVALVEARDFGGGASWNSLKTVHGGLRHLQRFELRLLRESVRERRALLRIAPALVQPLRFVVPTYGHGRRGREALAAGVLLSGLLSLDRNRGVAPERRLPGPQVLSRHALLDLLPGLPARSLSGGVAWHDAQLVSSERLLLAVLEAAAALGASLANRVELLDVRVEASRVKGVLLRDRDTGQTFGATADVVVNAAGPDAERVWKLAGVRRPRVPLLRGVNLVFEGARTGGAAVGALHGGRFLFLVPWRGRTMAGTAYADPRMSAEEMTRCFVSDLREAFPWAGLGEAATVLVHDGRVPGDERALWSHSLMVDHAAEGAAGLVSALGAKYTTARAVAERTVDAVFRRLGRHSPRCRTAETLLPGARLPEGEWEAQVRRAVREEMAGDLEDVVMRRLELGALGRPDPAVLERVAKAAAGELGWDAARLERERTVVTSRWPADA